MNQERFDSDWGVVQELTVEADTEKALLGALMVVCVQHDKATHYVEGMGADEANSLALLWGECTGAVRLPFPLDGPEEMTAFVRKWLEKSAIYPTTQPDTDGSVNKGFRVEADYNYVVARIYPTWIIYGK